MPFGRRPIVRLSVKPGTRARRAGAVVMVHHVAAERAAGVGEAVGKARALRVEQQAHRLDRRRAEEDDARRELASPASSARRSRARRARDCCFGSYSTSATTLFGRSVRLPVFVRRGQRRAEAVEVRVRDAAALARAAVVARRAGRCDSCVRIAARPIVITRSPLNALRIFGRASCFDARSSASAAGTRRRAAATVLRARR